MISYLELKSKGIKENLESIADLRIKIFREYPYLYDGSLEYEKKYLSRYYESSRARIFLAKNGNQIIGASSAIPLEDEDDEFKLPFIQNGYDISKIFYFGESIILPEFRGNKIGHNFFVLREESSRNIITDLKVTTFCAVNREQISIPEGYRKLDHFWGRMGYSKNEKISTYYSWKDIDQQEETKKKMTFWLKRWE